MALTFRGALRANVWSSGSGMAMQAATAPLLLLAFSVDQYATWVLVTAVCSYVSLALNGLFYALMNEITIAAAKGQRRDAQNLYATGSILIFAASLVCCVAAAILTLASENHDAALVVIFIGLSTQFIGLSAIMFDANFRAMARYQFGTNFLTVIRVLDWAVSIAAAFLFKDIFWVLSTILLYKAAQTAAIFAWTAGLSDAMVPYGAFRRQDLVRIVRAAHGQVLVSTSTAAMAIGPQLVVSIFYTATEIVQFSTFRTYLRLLYAGVGVLTSASWPLLTGLYSEGRLSEIDTFVSNLLKRSLLLAVTGGVMMVAFSGPIFHFLFRAKVSADQGMMSVILCSVLINCCILVYQSVFVSTNMRSPALVQGLIITSLSLVWLALMARLLPLTTVLVGQIAFDLWLLRSMQVGAKAALGRQASPA